MDLITNRTQADVDRVKEFTARGWANLTEDEKDEWRSGMKGAYNATDLNRVETAVEKLAARLGIEVTVKKTWSTVVMPTTEDMTRYLDNIRALRKSCVILPTTPAVPATMTGLTYIKANDIEQILTDIELVLDAQVRCGEVFCGEV